MSIVVRLEIVESAGASVFSMVKVTSQDGRVNMRLPMIDPLRARLKGRTKAYFHMNTKDEAIEIADEAQGESW